MKRNLFVLASGLTLCAGASFAGGKPEWTVKGASSEYPREAYVTGVGLGDKEDIAKERARSEVSKFFKLQVSAKLDSAMSETNRGKGDKTERSFSTSVSDSVQTVTNGVLEGVEVVDAWKDPATKVYYALAVLEREKAKGAIEDKIKDLDGQAQEWSSQVDASSEKLGRIKAAMRLLALLKAREDLNGQYRVLDSKGRSIPSPFNQAQVKSLANKAIAQLEVYVDFQCAMKGERGETRSDCGDEVETGIIKGLTSFGFEAQTATTPAEMDIVVSGKVATGPMKGDNKTADWKWARSTVTVSLKDGRTSKTIQRFDVTDRQASGDYDEAARRSRVKLAEKVAKSVREYTTEYFENQ
ncbi:MAG: LPP20 family lipoprotein [Elusimicrobia bacterium]|nr:LPP20 family lipoprotein [Elusimicrobiota bacterium]